MVRSHLPGDPYFPNQENGGRIEENPEEDPEEIIKGDPEDNSEEEPEEEKPKEDIDKEEMGEDYGEEPKVYDPPPVSTPR